MGAKSPTLIRAWGFQSDSTLCLHAIIHGLGRHSCISTPCSQPQCSQGAGNSSLGMRNPGKCWSVGILGHWVCLGDVRLHHWERFQNCCGNMGIQRGTFSGAFSVRSMDTVMGKPWEGGLWHHFSAMGTGTQGVFNLKVWDVS